MFLLAIFLVKFVNGGGSRSQCRAGMQPHPTHPNLGQPVISLDHHLDNDLISEAQELKFCRQLCCLESGCRGIGFWTEERLGKNGQPKERCRLLLAPFETAHVTGVAQTGIKHETLENFEGTCNSEDTKWIYEHKLKDSHNVMYTTWLGYPNADDCKTMCCAKEGCFGVSVYTRQKRQCRLWWVPFADIDDTYEWQEVNDAVEHWINPEVHAAHKANPIALIQWPTKKKRFTKPAKTSDMKNEALAARLSLLLAQKNGNRVAKRADACKMRLVCEECMIKGEQEISMGVMTRDECKEACLNLRKCEAIDFIRTEGELTGQCIVNVAIPPTATVQTAPGVETIAKQCDEDTK